MDRERTTPFSNYPFNLDEPLSGQAMKAYRERVIEPLQEVIATARKPSPGEEVMGELAEMISAREAKALKEGTIIIPIQARRLR